MISTDKFLIQVVYIYISQQSITINRIKLLFEHFVALFFSSNNCNYVIGYA